MKNYKDLKTFEEACKVLNLDAKKVIPTFSFYPENDRKAMIAHAKLVIIIKASNQLANEGKEWIPNWKDINEYKYEAWFDMDDSSSGSRFSFDDFDFWCSYSVVGSRLCFISIDVTKYIANQFIDLYKDYFVK